VIGQPVGQEQVADSGDTFLQCLRGVSRISGADDSNIELTGRRPTSFLGLSAGGGL
jgi:hypothetical protein